MEGKGVPGGHLHVQVAVIADTEVDDRTGRVLALLEKHVHIAVLV